MVLFAYLRLLTFFWQSWFQFAIHPFWHFTCQVYTCQMYTCQYIQMYSDYKFNKQSNNIQLCLFAFPILNQSFFSMSGSNCCFLSCTQVFQETGKVVRYSHLLNNFPQFVEPYSQRLSWNQWRRSRYFSGLSLLSLWSKKFWQFDLWFFCLF